MPADLPAEGVDACEEFLVQVAVGGDVPEIGRRGRELLESVRAESLEDVEERAHRHRELTIGATPVDGLVSVKGRLTTEDAETLKTALSPLAAPRPAEDGTPDPRSAPQRTADALTSLARHSLDTGTVGVEATVRPHISVTVDAERLVTGKGALAQLTHLGALSDAAVRRLACDCDLTTISLDANLASLDVGRTTRLVTRELRRALIARDKGCAFPGCGRPPGWTEAHHIWFWGDGGPTKLSNLVLLCGHHHRVIHHQGWQVRMGDDRHPWFTPPAWVDPDRQPRPSHTRRATPLIPTAA